LSFRVEMVFFPVESQVPRNGGSIQNFEPTCGSKSTIDVDCRLIFVTAAWELYSQLLVLQEVTFSEQKIWHMLSYLIDSW